MAQAYAQLQMGINKYPAPNALSGCRNDLLNFTATCRGYGYKPVSNNALVDRHGTAANFRNGLQALLRRTEPFVVVQYSGHGTSVDDISRDEQTDQAIVPVDFATRGLILDDEFGAFAERCAEEGKRGLFILDSCYSGKSSFGWLAATARLLGSKESRSRELPPGAIGDESISASRFAAKTLKLASRDAERTPAVNLPNVWLTNTPLIFLEMARHDETASDSWIPATKRFEGAGTNATCLAWRELGKYASYLRVIELANEILSKRGEAQRIQIEGRWESLQLPFMT